MALVDQVVASAFFARLGYLLNPKEASHCHIAIDRESALLLR
jgi:hypothetical protein